MLVLSTRRDNSTIWHGPTTWHVKDIRNRPLTEHEVRVRLVARRVCVLAHGFNVDDAFGAYAEIAYELRDQYDVVIGMTWPGSTFVSGFWSARYRAAESGKRLAAALAKFHPSVLDIQGHSMGCRVALEALKAGLHCRNLILAAAAVGSNALADEKKGYGKAANNASRIIVAHSHDDAVLRAAYRFALWGRALGLDGPAQSDSLPPHVETWDLSGEIEKHGDYKRSQAYLDRWRAAA